MEATKHGHNAVADPNASSSRNTLSLKQKKASAKTASGSQNSNPESVNTSARAKSAATQTPTKPPTVKAAAKGKSARQTKAGLAIKPDAEKQQQHAMHINQEQRRQLIATAAYLRAEKRGFNGGDPVEDWLQAESEIDTMLG